jgi:hypothetical protein
VIALFRLLGVDYIQWKAVSRTLLRTDFRLPLSDSTSSMGRLGSLAMMATILSFVGMGAGVIVYQAPDPLLSSIFVLTYLGVMLATTLLTQHGMTMLSTTDYVILGPRPVSSRTFLAIRVANVVFHAAVITTLTAWPVLLTYALSGDRNAARTLAAALAIYVWAFTIALLLVAAYGGLVRAVGADRMKRAVGYLQMLGGFVAYGGLFFVNRLFAERWLASATLPDTWWLVALPPAWFASYLELAAGVTNSTTTLRAVISIAALTALAATLRGRMSLDYARRIAELPHAHDAPAGAATRTPFFSQGERRAVAILVLSHFRHDLRVRMSVLAVIPLVLLYMFVGRDDGTFDLVAFAVLLFPAILTRHFVTSDTHQASWMYHATPADHARVIVALKNVAIVYFVLPFLLLVVAVFTWRFGDLAHAVIHTTMLGLISHVALQGSMFISPRLPFALPPDKTTGSATLMGWMIVVILGGQAALVGLDRWVYPSAGRVVAAISLLLLTSWLLNRAIRWRVRPSRT